MYAQKYFILQIRNKKISLDLQLHTCVFISYDRTEFYGEHCYQLLREWLTWLNFSAAQTLPSVGFDPANSGFGVLFFTPQPLEHTVIGDL